MSKEIDSLKKRMNILSEQVTRLTEENNSLRANLAIAENTAKINSSLKEKTDSIAFSEIAKMNARNQELSNEIVLLKQRLRKYEKVD